MEGKAVVFKKFAGIDVFGIENGRAGPGSPSAQSWHSFGDDYIVGNFNVYHFVLDTEAVRCDVVWIGPVQYFRSLTEDCDRKLPHAPVVARHASGRQLHGRPSQSYLGDHTNRHRCSS
jgi:hypothetical protein